MINRKWLLSLTLFCLMLVWLLPSGQAAVDTVDISENFPDADFREFVKQYDLDSDGYLSAAELAAVKTMNCSSENIADLTGIEYFTALTYLDCYSNQLTSLDVSSNTALMWLYCDNNQLTSLDVSSNTALTSLFCCDNRLTSLDVSSNTALTYLDCEGNHLTSLDVSAVPAIKDAVVNGTKNTSDSNYNKYSSEQGRLYVDKTVTIITDAPEGIGINAANFPDADFREFVKKYDLDSSGYLSAAELGAVTTMNCGSENIADLTGIEHFTALTKLWCDNNQLTSLDVSSNTALTELSCYDNQLTSLDVSSNTALTRLSCYDNQLTSLDVSSNTALTKLWCDNNQLTSLDVSSNAALTELSCYDNHLTSLDVSSNTALTRLSCSNNQLTSLDVSSNTALTSLFCDGNPLTSLDVSANIALKELWCYDNQLTSLDVSSNTALTSLYCYRNQLTSLDVSHNTALTHLYCYRNQLTSLDVSFNTALMWLSCENNQLTSLDVSAVPAIKDAVVNGTKYTSDSNYNEYSSEQGTLYVDKTVTIVTDAPATYTVTYDANGGIAPAPATVKAGSKYTVTDDRAISPGKIFRGWRADGKEYGAGDRLTVNGDTVLVALWYTPPIDPTGVNVVGLNKALHGENPDQYPDYDMNGDGHVTIIDLVLMAQYVADKAALGA